MGRNSFSFFLFRYYSTSKFFNKSRKQTGIKVVVETYSVMVSATMMYSQSAQNLEEYMNHESEYNCKRSSGFTFST